MRSVALPVCFGKAIVLRDAPARHFALYASLLPVFRVLRVWIDDRLPVTMFMHALVSFVSIILTSVPVSAATMWVLLAAVVTISRRPLSRQPPQTSVD